MQKQFSLRLKPAEAADNDTIKKYIAAAEGKSVSDITGFYIHKRSIDARSRQPWINLTIRATLNEPFIERPSVSLPFQDVHQANRSALIVGAYNMESNLLLLKGEKMYDNEEGILPN
jgi:hypothetical protein